MTICADEVASVYVYVYICIRVCVHMYIYMYMCLYRCIGVFVHACVYIHVNETMMADCTIKDST